MDTNHKKILKALSLGLRHLLEGEYDATGEWHGGDLEQRLNALGVWRDRDPLPADELPPLTPSDREARDVVDAYLELRHDAGIPCDQAVGEFVRETAYTWANRLLALRCMEARGLIDEVILQKPVYGGRSLEHHRLAQRHPELCIGEDDGLFAVLEQAFERQAKHLPLLFDPQAPGVALKPSVAALKRCVALLSGTEAVKGREAATDEIFKAPDALGWAYQYWNTEEKDRVFEKVRTQKGAKIEGADIIPATQLYTEPYMVKFLVQNSLGAVWMGMYPESRLYERWEYYVRDADRAPVERKPVREITFLDPAGGSGHFLLEAFDLFYDMYLEEGEITDPQAICISILQHNLFGIDIDERAVQIAEAALWMKSAERMKAAERAFDFKGVPTNLVATNIRLPKGRDHLEVFLAKYPEDAPLRPALEVIFEGLEHADELGSLLQIEEPVEKELRHLQAQYAGTVRRGVQIKMFEPTAIQGELPLGVESYEEWKAQTLARLKEHFAAEAQAADLAQYFFSRSVGRGLVLFDLLAQRYDIVAANPPYMYSRQMGKNVKSYLARHYGIAKNDLYTAFIKRCGELLETGGTSANVVQFGFLFLTTLERLRRWLFSEMHPEQFAHLGPHAFSEVGGENVNTVLSIVRKPNLDNSSDCNSVNFLKLDDVVDKAMALHIATADSESPRRFRLNNQALLGLPGCVPTYWLPEPIIRLWADQSILSDLAVVTAGLVVGNGSRFIRYYWEVDSLGSRWTSYVKGGSYSPWLDDEGYVVEWEADGQRIKGYYEIVPASGGKFNGRQYYKMPGITYNLVSSAGLNAKYLPVGFIFDISGPSIFVKNGRSEILALLVLLNSWTVRIILKAMNPSLSCPPGTLSNLPVPRISDIKWDELSYAGTVLIAARSLLNAKVLTSKNFSFYHLYDVSAQTSLLKSAYELWLVDWQADSYAASILGQTEINIAKAYGLEKQEIDFFLTQAEHPVGWFPLLKGCDTLPALSDDLPASLYEVQEHLLYLKRQLISSRGLADLKCHLRAFYEAGPGAKVEDIEVTTNNDSEDDDNVERRIPIPAETFLEELAQKLEIHPVSVYWLLKEGIEQEGWRCLPEERRITADRFTVTILRLLGHRWPRQIEAGEPVPALANADGIIPLTEGADEPTLQERVRERIAEESEGGDVTAIEREFEEIMGKPLERWLTTEFFKHHTRQFKKRPIAWQIQSGRFTTRQRPAFACLVYYHKLDGTILATIQSQYVRPLRQRYETELRGIESIPAAARSARQDARRVELEAAIHELRDFDAALEQVATEGFASQALEKIVAQEPLDGWCLMDGVKPPPEDREALLRQEQSYIPDINDGVRVNVAPLQKAGLLAAKVLSAKDADKAVADRAEWRADERRWCREGKLPRPGWWK